MDTSPLRQWFPNLATEAPALGQFSLDIALSILVGFILGRLLLMGREQTSFRQDLASSMALIVMTTTLVISIIKSSLALSLGLVGALSIIRFRTAIREPQELACVFMCFASGIGIGAGHRTLVVLTVAFYLILAGIRLMKQPRKSGFGQILQVRYSESHGPEALHKELSSVCPSLKEISTQINDMETRLVYGVSGLSAAELFQIKTRLTGHYPELQLLISENPEVSG